MRFLALVLTGIVVLEAALPAQAVVAVAVPVQADPLSLTDNSTGPAPKETN